MAPPTQPVDPTKTFPVHLGGTGQSFGSGIGPAPIEPIPLTRMNELVPEYTFVSVIGIGGMGVVYKAYQKTLGRLVAIKLLPPELTHESSAAARFEREAKAMAQLSHPNIVSVIDYGQTEDGHRYIVMEYVHGRTLSECMDAGELTIDHLLTWVPQVCDALSYAHRKGIIHRDIKPSNVLIGQEGGVKISDFGVARLGGERFQNLPTLTNTAVAVGTLHYIAPEAMEPGSKTDHRVDVYSVGVMVYQLLTGSLPFGSWMAPSRQIKGLDPRFDALVVHAMAPDPGRRTSSVDEITTSLIDIRESPSDLEGGSEETNSIRLSLGARRSSHAVSVGTQPVSESPPPVATESVPDPSLRWVVSGALLGGCLLAALSALFFYHTFLTPEIPSSLAEASSAGDIAKAGGTNSKALAGPLDADSAGHGNTATVPVGKADGTPVRVVLISGQSNVDGIGPISLLEEAIIENPTDPALAGLRSDGDWTTRSDVWLARSGLSQGSAFEPLSALADASQYNNGKVGVALGAGFTIGDAVEEPVVLLRASFGPGGLGDGFRPPHLEALDYDRIKPENMGKGYGYLLRSISEQLQALPTKIPEAEAHGFEISALIWFQGWNDSLSDGAAKDYGENLEAMTTELRKALATPDLPIIVGEFSPQGETNISSRELIIREQQRLFPERPEFQDSSVFVPTANVHDPSIGDPRLGFLYGRQPNNLVRIGRVLGEATIPFLQEPAQDRSEEILAGLDVALRGL